MSVFQQAGRDARGSGAPATVAILGITIVTFVLSWLMKGALFAPLQFYTNFSQPWGLLTYPFASSGIGTGFVFFLVELLWLYMVGVSVENDLGTKKFLAVWAIASVVAALMVTFGVMLVYGQQSLPIAYGLSLPLGALTVIWGVRNPAAGVRLMMVIPVPGIVLSWVTLGATLFGFGSIYQAPIIGAFACVHLGLAWMFAANRLPFALYRREAAVVDTKAAKKTEMMSKEYYDDVARRAKERADRERLKKLFEDNSSD